MRHAAGHDAAIGIGDDRVEDAEVRCQLHDFGGEGVIGEVGAEVFEALNYLDVGFTLDVGRFELVHFGLV